MEGARLGCTRPSSCQRLDFDPKSKAKSLVFIEVRAQRARELFERHLAALENEGLLLAASVYGASFAICASSSASVRRSSSEYRSLLLSSSC